MKWLQFLVLFLAIIFIHADDTAEVSSDELDISFYGIEHTVEHPEDDDAPLESEETVETEVEPETELTTALPTRGPWTRGQGRRGHRHHGRHHGGHSRRPHHSGGRGSMTPEAKLNYICNSLESGSDRMARMFQYKMARLTPEQRATAQQMMTARKEAMSECCQMAAEERQQCAENLRNQRYERVCNGEEALCMWAELKGDSSQTAAMSATVERCCASTGQERYTCFTEARSQHYRGGSSRRDRSSWGSRE